jgi:hypothetical protein
MKHRVPRYFCLILIASIVMRSSCLHAAEIVVHRAVKQGDFTRNFARLLFTMRLLRWSDGTRVHVFVLPDSDPLHSTFAKQTLDLYPRQLRRVWDRHLFSGSGAVPVTVDSVEEMLRRVSETPGAIGYLPDGLAKGAVRVMCVQ